MGGKDRSLKQDTIKATKGKKKYLTGDSITTLEFLFKRNILAAVMWHGHKEYCPFLSKTE